MFTIYQVLIFPLEIIIKPKLTRSYAETQTNPLPILQKTKRPRPKTGFSLNYLHNEKRDKGTELCIFFYTIIYTFSLFNCIRLIDIHQAVKGKLKTQNTFLLKALILINPHLVFAYWEIAEHVIGNTYFRQTKCIDYIKLKPKIFICEIG